MGCSGVADLFLERDAVISDCGKYRYLLRRTWNHDLPRVLFVMLNPSTADAEVDDATIRSCMRLCRSWNYGSFEVVNLYGWRATDPKALFAAAEPVGDRNDRIIETAIERCDLVIFAWGAHKMVNSRARAMRDLVLMHRPQVFCLGTTKAGHPKHPLYIKSGTPLQAFSAQ